MKKIITILFSLFVVMISFAQDYSNIDNTYNQQANEEKTELAYIHPNPTSDSFSIANLEGVHTITMYSVNGKVVLQQNITSDDVVHISHLPKGIYLIKLDGRVYKVVKQ